MRIAKYISNTNGKVYAFEPQRIVFQQFCANVFLNRLDNVHAYNIALGDTVCKIQIPELDFWKSQNIGGFSVDANMGSCRMEIVAEIPVPTNTSVDFSFKIRFYVHGSGWGKTEEQINAGLATQEVGNEIVVKFNNTELMGMSTGLVCKNTTLPVPASNVTRAKVAGGASTL